MGKEKVSIVLPTYNRAYCLKDAVTSVLQQTYTSFELILVDDGSTDGTQELIAGFSDPRIRYFKTSLNQGAAAARNYGIRQVQSRYLAFQDSDDKWHPDKLEKQMKALDEAGEKAGFCYHEISYDMGENKSYILPARELEPEKKTGNIYKQLLWDNLVDCPSILVKMNCIQKVGAFDEQLKALEDYDLALRLARSYEAVFVDEVLLDSAYTPSGVSLQATNYLTASCLLVQKYKQDYLATNSFDHRLEIILRDAERVGLKNEYVAFLEKIMQL